MSWLKENAYQNILYWHKEDNMILDVWSSGDKLPNRKRTPFQKMVLTAFALFDLHLTKQKQKEREKIKNNVQNKRLVRPQNTLNSYERMNVIKWTSFRFPYINWLRELPLGVAVAGSQG